MKLNLGVIDIPYTNDTHSVTTYQVATWLENKYHIMEVFVGEKEKDIAEWLADSYADSLESQMQGAPATADPFAAAFSSIETSFKKALDGDFLAKLGYPGVPTQAALRGKSARFKRKSGPPRPSFIDTGQYQASFKTWSEPS